MSVSSNTSCYNDGGKAPLRRGLKHRLSRVLTSPLSDDGGKAPLRRGLKPGEFHVMHNHSTSDGGKAPLRRGLKRPSEAS